MREAVLDTRVDQSGRALVLFRGAPLQGCSGLEMSAAVSAIAAWASANNGIVRMHTTLPDGSTSEDLIHGDGTVIPAARAGSGRRTAAPEPASVPRPAPVPSLPPAAPILPPVQILPREPVRDVVVPEPAPVTLRPNPFAQMSQAESDPPRPARRFVKAADIASGTPEPRTQASWRMPLEDDEEVFDVETMTSERPPPSSALRRILLRAGVIILLAVAAALLGAMFLLPAPAANAASTGPAQQQASRVAAAPSGIGDELPENQMLTFALAGGLAVAAGGTGGLLLTKALRKPRPSYTDDLDDELLLNELDISPLPGDEEADPGAGENPGIKGTVPAE